MKTTSRPIRSDLKPALGFLAPNLIGFLLFLAGPMIFSLGASFTNWNLDRSAPFAFTGFDNFVRLWHDREFWLYFVNTIYLMIGIPVAIAGSLVLALLLNQNVRGMTAYRTLFYLPTFTSGVALMLLWKALYNPDFGPINVILGWLIDASHVNALLAHLGRGPIAPPDWLTSSHNLLALAIDHVGFDKRQFGVGARDALVNMGVWTAIGGNNMLLYLAALTNIPKDLYEAAEIDGAGRWHSFWHVTWPQLAPTTFFIVVISFIGGLQGGFEQARVMTQGKPNNTTVSLTYYIYIKGFEQFQMGYASAIAWVLFLLIFAITLVNWRFGRSAAAVE
jgi:multiple sugar transport system permease protein